LSTAVPPEYERDTTRNTVALSISPERLAKTESLVAKWEPNLMECEVETVRTGS
jgi:hypothetical protein